MSRSKIALHLLKSEEFYLKLGDELYEPDYVTPGVVPGDYIMLTMDKKVTIAVVRALSGDYWYIYATPVPTGKQFPDLLATPSRCRIDQVLCLLRKVNK